MENNNIKAAELRQILFDVMNNPETASLISQQQMIVEAIGILRHPEFEKDGRLVKVDDVLINFLDVERYREIMQNISSLINKNNRSV